MMARYRHAHRRAEKLQHGAAVDFFEPFVYGAGRNGNTSAPDEGHGKPGRDRLSDIYTILKAALLQTLICE